VESIITFCVCFSNRDTTRDEFIFYSKRLMRLLIEFALSMLPFKVLAYKIVQLMMALDYSRFCGVSRSDYLSEDWGN